MLKCEYCVRFAWGSKCNKNEERQECVCNGDATCCELHPEVRLQATERRSAELSRRTPVEWFDFEKKKPVHGDEVFGIDTDGKMDIYQFSEEFPGCLMKDEGIIKVFNITHWTYLIRSPEIKA